jgi:hypothetical protein
VLGPSYNHPKLDDFRPPLCLISQFSRLGRIIVSRDLSHRAGLSGVQRL